MKISAENIANATTTPSRQGEKPYQRQVVTFRNELERATGINKVQVAGIRKDASAFPQKYDPGHPAADAKGYVMTPNVNPIMESMDMREAQRAYEANLNVIDAAKSMMLRTIDLIRS